MHRQPMDLADTRVADTIERCERGLERLLGTTTSRVFMYAANGHGASEVVIENLLPPDATVLAPSTGHFHECLEQVRERHRSLAAAVHAAVQALHGHARHRRVGGDDAPLLASRFKTAGITPTWVSPRSGAILRNSGASRP